VSDTQKDSYEVPVHVPEELLPLTTSQYDPLGRAVVKVAFHAESALLIATKPRDPVGYHVNHQPIYYQNCR